jgi:hypothetical protein
VEVAVDGVGNFSLAHRGERAYVQRDVKESASSLAMPARRLPPVMRGLIVGIVALVGGSSALADSLLAILMTYGCYLPTDQDRGRVHSW